MSEGSRTEVGGGETNTGLTGIDYRCYVYLRERAATDLYSVVTTSDENIDTVVDAEMIGIDVEYAALCDTYSTVLA